MAHSAGRVLPQRWWKFRRSYSQVILLNCSLMCEARLTVVIYSLGNRQIHLFFSVERQETTLAEWLWMKRGAAAQRSLDLQQRFNLKCSWEALCFFFLQAIVPSHGPCSACHWSLRCTEEKGLFYFLRPEISTTIPAVHDAAGVIRCSQKERRCICKVSKRFTRLPKKVHVLFTVSFIWFQNA